MEEFSVWATDSEKILDFLKRNRRAYTPKGIAIALKMDDGNVGASLSKLKEKNLVISKTPYWALNFKKRRE